MANVICVINRRNLLQILVDTTPTVCLKAILRRISLHFMFTQPRGKMETRRKRIPEPRHIPTPAV
ncbi:uncharacterized protein Dwil_GK28183 [Drosophila willistoni]|uniref:Uncharacterized protein n=1 Tax=Drosophila willistoni TaxID=7260 RepID=A0A0Q9X607_DROWI|nr:uncharacterized protein Dwil_GK28183 [Drosophila willistoni]